MRRPQTCPLIPTSTLTERFPIMKPYNPTNRDLVGVTIVSQDFLYYNGRFDHNRLTSCGSSVLCDLYGVDTAPSIHFEGYREFEPGAHETTEYIDDTIFPRVQPFRVVSVTDDGSTPVPPETLGDSFYGSLLVAPCTYFNGDPVNVPAMIFVLEDEESQKSVDAYLKKLRSRGDMAPHRLPA